MIRLKNICKTYGGRPVLSDFSCTFDQNSFTALVGPSGSGKTTLLRLMAGLEKPDSGEIEGLTPGVGMVFQEPRLFSHLSARDNVACVGGAARAEELLCAFGMEDALNKKPAELSGGMQQRVSIARAVASGSRFLLLDEPFKGLDLPMKKLVMDYLSRHVAGGVVVTHDREEAEYLASSILRFQPLQQKP